mmetsp:Transcript_15704/g.15843  ORF Transcript_15704/g.15843 Transcript_15704/m.15843 type:complete len:334 (-) Transcript_15704:120-1121(-)
MPVGIVTVVIFLFLVLNVTVIFSLFSGGNSANSNLRKSTLSIQSKLNLSPSSKKSDSLPMSIPQILYGTAWKKERTADLVYLALNQGFRGIDTACQPKHYNEPGVGEALRRAYEDGIVSRSELFLQTKFTSVDGQDPNNIPYDKDAVLEDQVQQSLETSLTNLKTDYLDSLILHSPMRQPGDTLRVWRVFEKFVNNGQVRKIGISNTYKLSVLSNLYDEADIKPSFLQNRFYDKSGYDKEIRAYCLEKGIQYQSFWTLTANPRTIRSDVVKNIAKTYSQTKEQIFFRFIKSLGIVPLSGTTSETHMREDLQATANYQLTASEFEAIESVIFGS